jgi:hypothetical protein
MDLNACHLADDPVGDDRRYPPCPEAILPVLSPSANHIKTFFYLRKDSRYIGGIILEISVHADNNFTACIFESRRHRRSLTEIFSEAHYLHSRILSVDPLEDLESLVSAAVIYKD